MKRVLVFLLLGPALVVAAWLILIVALDRSRLGSDFAALLFIFTFFVAAITVPIDGYLARALPLPLRAPLIAIVGSAFAVSLLLALASILMSQWIILPQWMLTPFAIGGALCMGMCSLVSHDYGRGQRLALVK